MPIAEYHPCAVSQNNERHERPSPQSGVFPLYQPVVYVATSAEECGVFQEKLFKFRGFYIQRRTIRQYSYNAAAHALGDIGEVSAKEMEADEEGYYIRGDYVGKLGVEKSYEKYLRGEKGI